MAFNRDDALERTDRRPKVCELEFFEACILPVQDWDEADMALTAQSHIHFLESKIEQAHG